MRASFAREICGDKSRLEWRGDAELEGSRRQCVAEAGDRVLVRDTGRGLLVSGGRRGGGRERVVEILARAPRRALGRDRRRRTAADTTAPRRTDLLSGDARPLGRTDCRGLSRTNR